jgi:TPR repeat
VRPLLLLAALLLAACQQPPALQAPVASAVSPAAQLRAEGDALMAGGNYAGAVEKFRQAIDLEPASVPLRFALGSAYSFLDRRLEAITQFRWVIANSEVGTTEHEESRRWLVRVGALVEARGAAVAKVESTPGEAKKVDPSAQGSIKGQTQWPGVTPAEHKVPLRVSMLGTEDETRGVQRRTELLLGESFEFKDVPEGPYRVVGIHDDRIIWDQRVTVKGGKQTDLAWGQADSSVTVNTFPPARR